MKEHDYAAALEHCKEPDLVADQTRAFIDVIHLTTIRHALRFAEKMCSAPTNNMLIEGMIALSDAGVSDAQEYDALKCFEKMVIQALKELGE